MSKVISVTSGGGDSLVNAFMMHKQGHEVILLHVDHHQKCHRGEVWACRHVAKELGCKLMIIDQPWLGKLGGSGLTDEKIEVPDGLEGVYGNTISKIFTPGRNIVLLGIAGAVAEKEGAEYITFGCNQSEIAYPDNTKEFLDAYTKALEYATQKIHPNVISPEWDMDKVEIYKWAFENGYGWALANYAWSCDSKPHWASPTKPLPCGKCGCCRNRRLVFYILRHLYHGLACDNELYANDTWFNNILLPELRKRGIPKRKWFSKYAEVLDSEVID